MKVITKKEIIEEKKCFQSYQDWNFFKCCRKNEEAGYSSNDDGIDKTKETDCSCNNDGVNKSEETGCN
jgi:hypothetical protein